MAEQVGRIAVYSLSHAGRFAPRDLDYDLAEERDRLAEMLAGVGSSPGRIKTIVQGLNDTILRDLGGQVVGNAVRAWSAKQPATLGPEATKNKEAAGQELRSSLQAAVFNSQPDTRTQRSGRSSNRTGTGRRTSRQRLPASRSYGRPGKSSRFRETRASRAMTNEERARRDEQVSSVIVGRRVEVSVSGTSDKLKRAADRPDGARTRIVPCHRQRLQLAVEVATRDASSRQRSARQLHRASTVRAGEHAAVGDAADPQHDRATAPLSLNAGVGRPAHVRRDSDC
jgi:hypothetical protein